MTFDFTGQSGRLEALIDLPAGLPRAAVVIAHPHPQYGGTMRSRVVFEAARGFTRAGAATLRFNFRGVGRSAGTFDEGMGEALDFKAAINTMAARYPGLPIWAAGHSFGAFVAATVAPGDDRVTALLAIAPPVDTYDFAPMVTAGKAAFVIQAERDQLCPLKSMHRFYARLSEPRELVVIDGADHDFDGHASQVGDAVEDLFRDFQERHS